MKVWSSTFYHLSPPHVVLCSPVLPCCLVLHCVAVMSANEQKDTVFQAIKGGAEEYLVKPVTKKEVQNIWQYVWKRLKLQQDQQQLLQPQQQQQQAQAQGSAMMSCLSTLPQPSMGRQ